MSGTHGAKVGPGPLPAAFYVIAAAALAADQLTKWIILSRVAPGSRLEVIAGLLFITHSRNPGAAFGMFPTATAGLVVAGVVIIAILLLYGRRVASQRPLWVGLALQVGGALGNLIDRVFRGPRLFQGRVVDFIDVQLTSSYTWPTFNVADIAITVGALLIALCIIAGKETPPAAGERPSGG